MNYTELLALVVLPAVANLLTLSRLRPHRIDIAPGQSFADGKSAVWQLNALNPANYDEKGRALLKVYFGVIVVQLAAAYIAINIYVP